jgi:hypothetical protein
MKRGALQKLKHAAVAVLLCCAEITFLPQSAQAATAGSGACQQTFTVTGTGEVAVYESGGYCFVAFKNTGAVDTQAIFTWTRPTQVTSVDALVVGGGGGGGARHGGGGGAGAFVQTDAFSISSSSSIAVAVGGGGSASTSYTGTNGQTSYFKPTTGSTSGLIALGGGGGANGTAGNGGSGGGAGAGQTAGSVTSQAQSTFAGVTLSNINFGNVGAAGASDTNDAGDQNDYWAGGGGGGANSSGSWPLSNGTPVTAFATGTSSTARGGSGGDGKSVSWLTTTVASNLSVGHTSSSTVYFSGGGGGGIGVDGLSGGAGGLGGGATGSRIETSGNAGTAHTGGGGGGSGFDDIAKAGSMTTVSAAPAGAGGSGVVVLRFIAPDIVAPTVSFTTFSTSPSSGWYGLGETATVQITYSETVTVSGTPRIPALGLSGKYFTYASGSGSRVLLFSYVVAVGDLNTAGTGVAISTLELNGGTIRDLALNDASLANQALNPNGFHKMDGAIPTLSSVATATDGRTIVITLSETQSAVSLSGSPFNVTINSTRSVVTNAVQSGTRITLTLTFGVIAGDTVSLTYTDPTAGNDTYALQDLAGNDVASFTQSVTNLSTATTNTSILLAVTPDTTTAIYRLNNSIVATVSTAGKVDFKLQGKFLAGCRNVSTTGSGPITATCTWKPSIHNSVLITATLKPSGVGFLTSTATPLPVFVLKRTNTR